jgi:hypothetical protein
MANQNGEMYGLTILSPIINDTKRKVSHDAALRMYLQNMHRHEESPFARLAATHLCRLVVMDDVVFVGHPAREEHLQSKYLIFNCDVHGDVDAFLADMARTIPDVVDAIWSHCVGYPGIAGFAEYIKKCQIDTTFYFADVDNRTVAQTLAALQMKVEFTAFVEENQGKPPAEVQREFARFWERVKNMPGPKPGATELMRQIAAGALG